MKCKRVLVTGATGFLGSRVVELLHAQNISVRAMGHSPGRGVRLARMNVETVWGDITVESDVKKAVEGCDVIIHCALGTAGDDGRRTEVTVEGTRKLAEAAVDQGCSRFVHISSIAVYSYSPPEHVTENADFVLSGDNYCDAKIDAEKAVWHAVKQQNLPAAVLRMGNIYGPFSPGWTEKPVSDICEGTVCLVDGGYHASNAVYVDNAVEAIFRAIEEDDAVGEAFFITDDELSWRELFSSYAKCLGDIPLKSISYQEVQELLDLTLWQRMRATKTDIVENWLSPSIKYTCYKVTDSEFLAPLVRGMWKKTPMQLKEAIRRKALRKYLDTNTSEIVPERQLPGIGLLQVYGHKTVFSNKKARELLKFRSQVSQEKALAYTHEWLNWAGFC